MRCPPQREGRSNRGRPRDPGIEHRVLETTLRLLGEQGFERLSVDEIAAGAGVSKPAIYRRWTGKADLATAALELLRVQEPAVRSDSGIEQVRAILRNFRVSLLRPNGMSLLGTVLAEETHNPELLRLFRERVVAPRRKMLSDAFEVARKRGEVPPGFDAEGAVAMLVGSFYARYLAGDPLKPDWIDRILGILVPAE